jgi:hypothetical protein
LDMLLNTPISSFRWVVIIMVPKQEPMNLKICVPSETSGYCSDRRYTYKELPNPA